MLCKLLFNSILSVRRLAMLFAFAVVCILGSASRADEDPSQVFNKLYQSRLQSATQSPSPYDDIELAKSMLDDARASTSVVGLLGLMCDQIYELSSHHPTGYDTAIEAMRLLAEHDPQHRIECIERTVNIQQRQYKLARGEQKDAAANALIDSLMLQVQVFQENDDPEQAILQMRRALSIASSVRSPRHDQIRAAYTQALSRKRLYDQAAQLKDQLKSNPDQQSIADELLRLYLVEMDSPAEARKYSFLTKDKDLLDNISLANRPEADLGEAELITLGDWYRELSAVASSAASQQAMLNHAQGYYTQYLARHSAEDLDRKKIELLLKDVEASLARFQSQNKSPSASADARGWVDLLAKIDPSKHAMAGQWSIKSNVLMVDQASGSSFLLVPIQSTGSYRLAIEFACLKGKCAMGLKLPMGPRNWIGMAIRSSDGISISDVAGRRYRGGGAGPAVTIQEGRKYSLAIQVRVDGDQAAIEAKLDGQVALQWSGALKDVSIDSYWKTTDPGTILLNATGSQFGFSVIQWAPVN